MSLVLTHTNTPAVQGALKTMYFCVCYKVPALPASKNQPLVLISQGLHLQLLTESVWGLRTSPGRTSSGQREQNCCSHLDAAAAELSRAWKEQGQALSYMEHVQVKAAHVLGMCINPSTAGQFGMFCSS